MLALLPLLPLALGARTHLHAELKVVPAALSRGLRRALQDLKALEHHAAEEMWTAQELREEALTQQQAAIERNNEAESKVNKSLARRERLLMKQQEICDVLAGWTGEVKKSSNRSNGLPVGIMRSPEKELFTPEPISSGVVNASKPVKGSVGINGSSNSSGWVYPLESSSPILFEPAKPVKNFNASVKRLRNATQHLLVMQQNLSNESRLYEDLKRRVESEIANLTEMQHVAYKRLRSLQAEVDAQQDALVDLRGAVERQSMTARNALDDVEAELSQVQEHLSKQTLVAEGAQQDYLGAKMRAAAAERVQMDAVREVQRQRAVAQQVRAARDGLQSYYKSLDALAKSMEARIAKESSKLPWQLLREDPNLEMVAKKYNNMTAAFRHLYVKSKDMYLLVAGAIGEIQENTEASILLQCDPYGSLEEAARASRNFTTFAYQCGPGLWQHLGIELESFPDLSMPYLGKAGQDQGPMPAMKG